MLSSSMVTIFKSGAHELNVATCWLNGTELAPCVAPLSYILRMLQGGAIGVGAAPAAAGQQLSRGDDVGSRPETRTSCHDRSLVDMEEEKNLNKNFASPSSPPSGTREAGDCAVDAGDVNSSTHIAIDSQGRSPRNDDSVPDKLINSYPAIGRGSPVRMESAKERHQQPRNTSKRHPLDTLRKKGVGGDIGGGRNGAADTGGGMMTADEITKLRASLKRAQEETAREKVRREVCEEQARVAYVSLEAESKR